MTFSRLLMLGGCLCPLAPALAQTTEVERLPSFIVTSAQATPLDQYELPSPAQTINADQAEDLVNAVDVEDDLKYFPDLFLRKRNDGDIQAVLATRDWGVNSSARTLVYADGVPLSALIANNNTIGAPRWGMVTPDEVQSVDVLYGPYAAAYPGNSMGAVVEITTRMPDHFESSASITESWQGFSQYGTRNTFLVNQTAVTVGDRAGPWSFWVSVDNEQSGTQPLFFVTASSLPAGTTGGFIAWNKLGQPADVLGASGIQDSDYATGALKVAYDFAPHVRAAYTIGRWDDDTNATVQTYLRDAQGQPTFAGVSGFASGDYHWIEEQTMQSLSVTSKGPADWEWIVTGSLYDFDRDTEQMPASASANGTAFSSAGKVALLSGTGWSNLDAKAAWYPDGPNGGQELSFGAHADEYELVNPTYNTPDWRSGHGFSSLATEGNGDTATQALWAQYVWRLAPDWKLTAGGRYEWWRAFDGINVNGGTTVIQPDESARDFSPKLTLAWTVAPTWTVSALVGNACRYPTAGELYQLVSTGAIYTSPNPDLLPERDWSEEIRAERHWDSSLLRFSLFEEDTFNALVSQYAPLLPGSATEYQYVMNVGRIRNRGAEVYADRADWPLPGLEVSANATYVDSRIRADAGTGQFQAAVGKRAPYVPIWRGTAVATYHIDHLFAWTLGARYSGQQYSTVDNVDVNPNVFGGFGEYFVMDTHLDWRLGGHASLSLGVDNLLNRKYFLYHPFPQRTVRAKVKCQF